MTIRDFNKTTRTMLLAAVLGCALTSAAKDKPAQTVRQLYERAMTLADADKGDEAYDLLVKASKLNGAQGDDAYPLVLKELAAFDFNDGEAEKATRLSLEAARLLPEKDAANRTDVYVQLGVIYRNREMTDSALHYYNKALEQATLTGNSEMLAQINMNVAVLYHGLKRFREASRQIDQGLKYAPKVEDAFTRFCLLQIGGAIKSAAKQTKEALPLARRAWQIAVGRDGNADMQMRCIPTMCLVYDALGKTDSVDHYLAIGTRLLELPSVSSFNGISFLQTRAKMNFHHKRWQESLDDLLFLKQQGLMSTPKNAVYEQIAVCLKNLGREHEAFLYMDSARMWTDTLAQKDLQGRIAEFHVKFQTQQKELQLSQMQTKNAHQQVVWTAVASILVLLIVLLAAVLFRLRQRHKLAALRQREEALLNEARQYISGLEGERKRLAEELHNGVANDLLGFQLHLESARTDAEREHLKADIAKIRDDVRAVSHGLMPPEFTHLDLVSILGHYAESLQADREVEVTFDSLAADDWKTLPKATAYEVFRVAQEWMANAIKHARAEHIVVTLEQENENGVLEIADDGQGIATSDAGKGIGLRVIEDRVRVIKGQWNIESNGDGTTCSLIFPLA